MTTPLFIVGCGGFGREVLDVVDAINAVEQTWTVEAFVDDSPSPENRALVRARGLDVTSDVSGLAERPGAYFVVGIAAGAARRLIDERLTAAGLKAATLIHPSATLGADTHLGPGSIVCAGVRMTTNIRCGRHTHLNLNTTVGHDVVMDDYVTANPLVAISGWVRVGSETLIGTHAAILQNLTVGRDATVGAGALVTKPVPDGVTVKGVPAK